MKRKTHEDFCNEVFEQVSNEYTVKSIYKNINTYVLMKHNICEHEWDVLPANFLKKKSRCPLCAGNSKITIDDFIKKLDEKYSGNAKLISEFNGLRSEVIIKFIDCGHEHTSNAVNFIYKENNGCNICNKNEKKTHEHFCKEVFDLVGEEYTVLGEYNRCHNKILIKHNMCKNEYPVTPTDFLSGKRCPICQHRSWAKTTEEFRKEVFDLVGNEYKVLGDYKNNKKHIKIKHNECGYEYEVQPSKFLSGRRCPECFKSKGEKECKRVLLLNDLIEITQNDYNMLSKIDKTKYKYFISQKEFKGLIGLKSGLLSYDFYLPNYSLLVEYQGEQHEKYIPGFHKSKKDFEKQVEHDKRKRKYAEQNNINLLEIWYFDFDSIEEILNRELNNYMQCVCL